jgi:selenocysteine-specific translation elongation factor
MLKYNKHHNKYMQNAWNKYGEENFIFEICCEMVEGSYCDLIEKEQEYLDLYFENNKKILYNHNKKAIYRGNEFFKKLSLRNKGRIVSAETKKKISNTLKGRPLSEETKRKMSEARMGHAVSAETREKLSKLFKGRPISEEQKKQISKTLKGRKHTKKQRENHLKALAKFKGEGNPSAKLTNKQARKIRTLRKEGLKLKELAETYNVSVGCVKDVVYYKTFKEI